MDAEGGRGQPVDAVETLYRFVTVASFWVAAENRPWSSLFDDPPRVSVNVASLTTVEKCRRQLVEELQKPDGGMVSFNCGEARSLDFDARNEPEWNNPAHAHLYCESMAPGTRKDLGYFWVGARGTNEIILCESAIDAISCCQLHAERICISTSGVRANPRWLRGLIAHGYRIHCGFDGDEAGEAGARPRPPSSPPPACILPPKGPLSIVSPMDQFI